MFTWLLVSFFLHSSTYLFIHLFTLYFATDLSVLMCIGILTRCLWKSNCKMEQDKIVQTVVIFWNSAIVSICKEPPSNEPFWFIISLVDFPFILFYYIGIYVPNLSHHEARNAEEVFSLLSKGKQELVTAETKMVRQSSRCYWNQL